MKDFLDAWAADSEERTRLLAHERLITEVTEALWEAMQRADVSKSELASRLGKTKGHVSQLFSGSRNMTLRTLAEISEVLDCTVSISIRPRGDQNALPLTPEQRAELEHRLDAYASDGNPGRPAEEVVADIRKRL